jgi:mRNA interferase MazF
VTVADVTTNVRGLDAEVALGPADGMPRPCVVNLDSLATIRRSVLGSRITTLGSARMQDVERAMHLALGVPLPCRIT